MMKTGTRANLVKKINYSHKYYPIMKQKLFMRLAAAAAVLLLSAATATAHDLSLIHI